MVGSTINSYKVINLSSVQVSGLKIILARFPDKVAKFKIIDILGDVIFDSTTMKKIMLKSSKLLATFIVDSDDFNANKKIKSICSAAGIVPVTIITLMMPKRPDISNVKTGKHERFAHFGHTKSVLEKISARSMNITNIKNIASATIVKTKDKRCGSVSGICLLLKMCEIPYTISTYSITYSSTWVDSHNGIKDFMIRGSSATSEAIPDADKHWRFKMGYIDYIMTEKGIKKLTERTVKPRSVWQRFYRWVFGVLHKIKSWFTNSKTSKSAVAFSYVSPAATVASHLAATALSFVPENASQDIKKANKVIARMQVNKMVSRSGLSGDKTILDSPINDTMAAYIAGTQSYGTTDAITTSNNLAATRYRASRATLVSFVLLVTSIVNLTSGNILAIIISTLMVVIDYFTNMVPKSLILYALALVSSHNIFSLCVNSMSFLSEYVIKDKKTRTLSMLNWIGVNNISSTAILAYDGRDEKEGLVHMQRKSMSAVITTSVTMTVRYLFISLLVLAIISSVAVNKIPIAMWLLYRYTVMIFSYNRMSSYLRYMKALKGFKLVLKFMTTWKLSADKIITDSMLYKSYIEEANDEIIKESKQWADLDKTLPPTDKYEISNYWQSYGLNHHKITSDTSCIRISAIDPLHPNVHTEYCIDVRDNLISRSIICELAKGWYRSDCSDEMHVKSIYKRLCSSKKQINFHMIKKQKDFISEIVKALPRIKRPAEYKLLAALATKGSAGQFSKGSAYEDIWKNAKSNEGVNIWKELSTHILQMTYILGEIDERIVRYMLYRKMEAIDSSDTKGLKPTRIMNAPNLVCRIADSITFTDFNEAIIEAREYIPSSLGMNIFLELKMVLFHNEEFFYMTSDFADYDCSQHPVQGYIVAQSRLEYNQRNNVDTIESAYILSKYKQHMRRTVRSTSGIKYDVIGQQASGDITTSDDNTLKTAGAVMIFCDIMKEQGMIKIQESESILSSLSSKSLGIDVTGDDTGLAFIPGEMYNEEHFSQAYLDVIDQLGWTVKPESFSIKQMNSEGLEYLSHMVEDRSFMTNMGTILTFRALTRPQNRAWGKFVISAEVPNVLSNTNKAKLASKYLTMAMASIGYPPMVLASLLMLVKLRAQSTDLSTSYSWAGIKAQTLGSVMLRHSIGLQTGLKFKDEVRFIQIKEVEYKLFDSLWDEYKESMMAVQASDNRLKRLKILNFKPRKSKWWDMYSTLDDIITLFSQLDKHGLIPQISGSIKWWEYSLYTPELIEDQHEHIIKGTINLGCDHITENSINALEKECGTKYNVVALCKKCYTTRKEKRYEAVFICCEDALQYNKVLNA